MEGVDGKRSRVNERQVPASDSHGPFVTLELQMLHEFQWVKGNIPEYAGVQ